MEQAASLPCSLACQAHPRLEQLSATLDNADSADNVESVDDQDATCDAPDDACEKTSQASPADSETAPAAAAAAESAQQAAVDETITFVNIPSATQPRYCRRCQESLSFFTSRPWRCWKCGLEFDPADLRTVLLRRTPLRWKFWFPGFCLAMSLGMLTFALLDSATAPVEAALMGAGPVCFGCLLGYGGDGRARFFGLALFVAAVGALAVLGAGLLGVCLAVALLIPTGIGMLFGLVLRAVLENSNWDQRWYFP